VNRTNYVPAIPPTDNFRNFSHYGSTNPTGTWQTKFWWGARTNNGLYGAVYYVDDTAGGLRTIPFTTGRSGLTITARTSAESAKLEP
jgi:hypothetical protein